MSPDARTSELSRAIETRLRRWGRQSREDMFEEFCLSQDHDPDAFREALGVVIAAGRARQIGEDIEPIATTDGDDFLACRSPAEYVRVLAGIVVAPGAMIRCPFPDHEDRDPSFKVYATAERGWYCFGCRRGGGIYQFAAAVAGVWRPRLRGAEFLAVEEAVWTIYERRYAL